MTIIEPGDRTHLNECGICHATEGEACLQPGAERRETVHVGRRWHISLCSPGARIGGPKILLGDGGRCRPTVEDNHRWDHTKRERHGDWSVSNLIYRGACFGCGWHGPAHDRENPAVEDAHDHAWPGWRDLPIVPRCPYDATSKQRQKWIATIATIYCAHGIDLEHWGIGGGAPIRTERAHRQGTRSHYSHDVKGFDICGRISDDTPRSPEPIPATQMSLFRASAPTRNAHLRLPGNSRHCSTPQTAI